MTWPLWFANLLVWSVQVAVLALAAGILVRILPIREPGVLLVCWRTLIGASLLLPVIEPWQRSQVFVLTPAGRDFSVPTSVIPTMNAASSPWHFPDLAMIAEILGAIVAIGIVVRFVMLALGLLKLRQLRRKSGAIGAELPYRAMLEEAQVLAGGCAEFRLCGEVDSPVTFGFARPVVLLPEKFLQLDAQFQMAIACHELLHVRRRDWAHHLGEEVLRAIFWFHPAILWLVARVRLAREQVVDLEVVRLTAARKTYVEALLEFTSGRTAVAIPAPLFLAERQLVERVSLMLKEAGMSRRRLIASLSVMGWGLACVAIFAVTVFPLKAAPRAAESGPTKGIARRVPGTDIQPVVSAKTIWVEAVKRGDLSFVVRATGTLVPASGKLAARVLVGNMDNQVREVQLGQRAEVDIGDRVLPVLGRVSELGESDSNGNRWVNIALDSSLPSSIGANSSVVGLIAVGKLKDVAYIPIPAGGWVMSDVEDPLFKIVDNGKAAVRVEVVYGRKGVKTVQVLSGLKVGDKVILSDMFPYNQFSRIEIEQSAAGSGASFSPVSDSDTPLAGKGGYGTPTCVYCPNPQYSDDAYRQKIQGRIVVDTVVGTDGRAHRTRVVHGLGHGLDEQAIHSVRDVWRFKPANGPDGKPATVRTLIDVSFHLY